MAERQLAFDLPLPRAERWQPDDFLISDANGDAVRWLVGWQSWPAPALILYGPAGCGKTHLVNWFRSRTEAVLFPVAAIDRLTDCILAAAKGVYIVEDADRSTAAAEEPLFHLYNVVAATGGHLLLTARVPPRDWPIRLPDLRSRLQAAPTAAILAPDDALIEGILRKLFADRQLGVEDEVLNYLLPRIERSYEAMQPLVDRLDREALAAQRRLTVPFVRSILAERREPDHS